MQFSQKQVAFLLEHRDTSLLSRYEKEHLLPPLVVALRLEIIYRTPVAFLFGGLYEGLRTEIRNKERRLRGRGQQHLF